MIKRVIFDIDNTLIDWKEEYNQEINKVLDELKIQYTEDEKGSPDIAGDP